MTRFPKARAAGFLAASAFAIGLSAQSAWSQGAIVSGPEGTFVIDDSGRSSQILAPTESGTLTGESESAAAPERPEPGEQLPGQLVSGAQNQPAQPQAPAEAAPPPPAPAPAMTVQCDCGGESAPAAEQPAQAERTEEERRARDPAASGAERALVAERLPHPEPNPGTEQSQVYGPMPAGEKNEPTPQDAAGEAAP